MPNYDYQCGICANIREVFLPLKEYADRIAVICYICNATTSHDIVLTKPAFQDWDNAGEGRFFEHLAPRGMTFHGKQEYRDYLKRNGLREWEPKPGMPSNGRG